MQVMRASEDQQDDLVRLFDEYRVFYGQESNVSSVRDFIAERIEKQDSVILVAMDKGTAVGFTQLYPSFSSVGMRHIWILNDLYVAQEFRRRGVARELMDKAHRFAKEDGAAQVILATQKNNDTAQSLYEKMGYTKDDEFVHFQLTFDP